jgi:hypothetical protein
MSDAIERVTFGQGSYGHRCRFCLADDYDGELVHKPRCLRNVGDIQMRLRDWIHETPLSLCDMGDDTCPDWDLAIALDKAILSDQLEDWVALRELTHEIRRRVSVRENDE